MTHKRNRPGVASEAVQEVMATTKQSVPPPADMLHVVADVIPPSGRRTMPVAVARCGWCGGIHLHRGHRLDGAVRTAGCGSREYVLTVRRG